MSHGVYGYSPPGGHPPTRNPSADPGGPPPLPPAMIPDPVRATSEDTIEEKPELTDDEYYMEQLRKENLLRTVKEMNEKQIFLFEIFIDSIEITKENELLLGPGQSGPLPPLIVRIKFANIPCFDIFEEEMLVSESAHQGSLAGKVVRLTQDPRTSFLPQHGQWKSTFGKSCLFCMIPMELIQSIQSSPVTVNVYRTAEENYDHPTSSVGHTRIRLEDDFVNCVIKTGDENAEFPVSGHQSQKLTLHNTACEETGQIDMFVRLSCFGNMISTQFQSLRDGKEYVFKHTPGKPQLNSSDKELPDEYVPPKLLGKTDLTPLPPIVVDEDQLFGCCSESLQGTLPKDLLFPKTVLWKERNVGKESSEKNFVCRCDCGADECIGKTDESYSILERQCGLRPDDSSSSLRKNYQDKEWQLNVDTGLSDTSVKKCYCASPCTCVSRQVLEDVKACNCTDCTCGQLETSDVIAEPVVTKRLFLTPKEKPTVTVSKKTSGESKLSVKASNMIGAGDSEHKVQTKQTAKDDKCDDKKEIDTLKSAEDIKGVSSAELRSADKGNLAQNKAFSSSDVRKPQKARDQTESHNKVRSKKKNAQFDYSSRDYPGLNIGHNTCADSGTLVPETMGWLWNIEDKSLGLKIRKGWRPGKIGKSVTGRIVFSKKTKQPTPGPVTSNRVVTHSDHSHRRRKDQKLSNSDLIEQPPTFRLQHTLGKYFLSMLPIKEEGETDESRKPVQIQVLPESDKDSASGTSVSAATSDTSIEVVFTCPGALRRKLVKPECADMDTQYAEDDLKVVEVPSAVEKTSKGKSRKDKKLMPKKTESNLQGNVWEEQETQMSLQKKGKK